MILILNSTSLNSWIRKQWNSFTQEISVVYWLALFHFYFSFINSLCILPPPTNQPYLISIRTVTQRHTLRLFYFLSFSLLKMIRKFFSFLPCLSELVFLFLVCDFCSFYLLEESSYQIFLLCLFIIISFHIIRTLYLYKDEGKWMREE